MPRLTSCRTIPNWYPVLIHFARSNINFRCRPVLRLAENRVSWSLFASSRPNVPRFSVAAMPELIVRDNRDTLTET